MRSRPASQLADDGEAVGTPVPAADDPSSAEPPVTDGGARKSVARAPDGPEANGGSGGECVCEYPKSESVCFISP